MKNTALFYLTSCCLGLLTIVVDAQLETDLQGYWQFNRNGFDSSAAGRDFDLLGDPGFSPGLLGCALSLNGNPSQFALRPINDKISDIAGEDFAIQIWVNFNSTSGEQTLIEKFTGGAGPGYTLTKLGSNQFQFFGAGLSGINSPALTIDSGEWHQVVMRRSGPIFEIFFNNTAVVQSNQVGVVTSSSNPLQIGERQGGQQFPVNGLIDEVAFWSRALSNTEITQLYNEGNGLALVPDPIFVPGDVNQDGNVNLLDVAPFVGLIASGDFQIEADLNDDCNVNLLDVSLFIDLLTGN